MLLCLVLGTITTVAVAWGCAWFMPSKLRIPPKGAFSREEIPSWLYFEARWIGGAQIRAHPCTALEGEFLHLQRNQLSPFEQIPAWFARTHGAIPERTDGYDPVYARVFGLPCRSLECWDASIGPGAFSNGINLPERDADWGERERFIVLPLRPIWPGFAIDTLFYAAIWSGVFFGFASAKRAIRRKRGRCPRCGYDLRGNLSAGCSECGWEREESAP